LSVVALLITNSRSMQMRSKSIKNWHSVRKSTWRFGGGLFWN